MDTFFSTDQSTNPGSFNTEIQKLSVFIPCQRFTDDFRCKHLKSEMCRYDFATSCCFLERNKLKYVGKKMDKRDNMPMKRTKPGNHSLSQASIELCSPKHKSQMFQLILHHSTNGDVHRLSTGFTTCKLAGGRWSFQLLRGLLSGCKLLRHRRLRSFAENLSGCPDALPCFNYCTRMDFR